MTWRDIWHDPPPCEPSTWAAGGAALASNLSVEVPHAVNAEDTSGPSLVPGPLDVESCLHRLSYNTYGDGVPFSGVRFWWTADARRRAAFENLPTTDPAAYVLGGALAVSRPGHRRRAADHQRLTRFLTLDPLTGVTVIFDDPIVTVTLETGDWTTARARAATLECQYLGAGLTLRYRPAPSDRDGQRPSTVGLVIDGSSMIRSWPGDARSVALIVPRRRTAA